MSYYELAFSLIDPEDFHQDLLINELAEAGFDTFEEVEGGFNAYVKSDDFDEEKINQLLIPYHDMFKFSYKTTLIPQKNWNEVWESNFEPIQILDQIYVRATFHEEKSNFPYEIIIDPKMAFGTGHHQTTALMLEWLLETDVKDKLVLDMGCGTGILAILASKMGAKEVDAIDYDVICYDSVKENAELNGITNLNAYCGSKEVIPSKPYEVILANINRNILLDQLEAYAKVMTPGAQLYLSGFYENPDLGMLKEEAEKYGLKYIDHKKNDEWVSAKFIK
jgi:ribosomal protein L11 methyltransferase